MCEKEPSIYQSENDNTLEEEIVTHRSLTLHTKCLHVNNIHVNAVCMDIFTYKIIILMYCTGVLSTDKHLLCG